MRNRQQLVRCLPFVGLFALACNKSTHGPPEPGEGVPKAAPVAAAAAEEPAEPPGFAAEIVPEPSAPPAAPSGRSAVGRFALAADPPLSQVFEALRKWVASKSGRLHAVVLDLESGQALVLHRAVEAVNPASNMKLLTAAAALDLLGPALTFQTELLAEIDASGLAPHVVLRGGGDPALSAADLARLVQSAKAQGLRSVGRLDVDQSLFDTPFVPPGFEQQPDEWASFRAPISAAALDGNTVTLNVLALKAAQPARIWYEPPGVVEGSGSVETGASGSGDRVGWTLDPSHDPSLLRSTVTGALAAGSARQRYVRRLDDPRRAPGLALRQFFSEVGITVQGAVGLIDRATPVELPARLTYVSSAPLSELLRPLGKDSDNFTAEMLLVALSRSLPDAATQPWSSARGALALRGWLEGGGIPVESVQLRNGSGLFDANRVTVETLALVLARMEARPEVFAEYLTQLAVYGTDGTLRQRMTQNPDRSRIRAKTGTLSRTDALSGYVLREAGVRPLVFSLVVEGAKGGHRAVRQAMDRAVFEWAKGLAAPAVPAPAGPVPTGPVRGADVKAPGAP